MNAGLVYFGDPAEESGRVQSAFLFSVFLVRESAASTAPHYPFIRCDLS